VSQGLPLAASVLLNRKSQIWLWSQSVHAHFLSLRCIAGRILLNAVLTICRYQPICVENDQQVGCNATIACDGFLSWQAESVIGVSRSNPVWQQE
jgi:hypothetical protein